MLARLSQVNLSDYVRSASLLNKRLNEDGWFFRDCRVLDFRVVCQVDSWVGERGSFRGGLRSCNRSSLPRSVSEYARQRLNGRSVQARLIRAQSLFHALPRYGYPAQEAGHGRSTQELPPMGRRAADRVREILSNHQLVGCVPGDRRRHLHRALFFVADSRPPNGDLAEVRLECEGACSPPLDAVAAFAMPTLQDQFLVSLLCPCGKAA